MLPQAGTYKAKTANGVVYETEGGALMVAFDFGIDEQTSIVGRVCLASKAGEVLQNNVKSLKEAFGWDGADPFYLSDTDLSTRDVEIVVEMENDQNGNPRPTVKWINAPGRAHGGLPQAGDRKAILAKYGAKLRALSGGTTMRPQPAQTVPAAAPKLPFAPPKPPPAAVPSKPTAAPGTLQDAWEAFCKAAGEMEEEKLTALWWKCVGEITGGKSQERCTPEDWGTVRDGADRWVGDQLPM